MKNPNNVKITIWYIYYQKKRLIHNKDRRLRMSETGVTTYPIYQGIVDRVVRRSQTNNTLRFDVVTDVSLMLVLPYYAPCYLCGTTHARNTMTLCNNNGVPVCDTCKHEYVHICDYCGMYHIMDSPTPHILSGRQISYPVIIGGKHGFVCSRCAPHFARCDQCGNLVDDIRAIGNNMDLCGKCADAYITTHTRCARCGTYTPNDRAVNGLCLDCYIKGISSQKPQKQIGGYHHTDGTLFLSRCDPGDCTGVELEVTGGKESAQLMQILYEYKEIELKRDASVPGGFEIASYPMSLTYHKTLMSWQNVFSALKNDGYVSHDNPKCGYHIHISRLAFGDTPRKQSKDISKFLYLFEHFRGHIETFSRRTDFGYCKFYGINYDNVSITRGYQKAVIHNKRDRNMCVNFRNSETIEVRVFRGTLNYTTFIAALELCEHLKNIANQYTDTDITGLSWGDIVVAIPPSFSALKAYLTKKNLLS